ncbi:MAG TPA: hypothetical protein VK087_00720 [Tissierellaceae bacterium]|nr:hypothetical protein [Tissierellaceae bacterium]
MKTQSRKQWSRNEITGTILVVFSVLILFISPHSLSDLFDVIVGKVFPVVVDTFLTSEVGIAVIVSVIVGRILERCGFTDGLIRIFVPIMKFLKINPAVVIPGIYNILGDINAAGRIAGPVLVDAKATKDEQKIAVATMIQSPQSFVTFVIGLMALKKFNINAFPIILSSIFLPLIIIPYLLKLTMYRNTKKMNLEELPRFTPDKPFFQTLFDSAAEGTELLLLVIIPAAAAIFTIIGALDYFGIWVYIESGFSSLLKFLYIEPTTGILSIFVAPTLAVAELINVASNIDPRWIVGSFVLANSGLPISTIFGQVPATWAQISDLNEREVLKSAVVGTIIRLITAFIIAFAVTPFII